jgi:ligand-binding sensor domain-containing protein
MTANDSIASRSRPATDPRTSDRSPPRATAPSGSGPTKATSTLTAGTLSSGAPTLWVGTSAGLAHCAGGRCALFATVDNGLPHSAVYALLETAGDDGGRALWVGTRGGLARLQAGQWQRFTAPSGPLAAQEAQDRGSRR